MLLLVIVTSFGEYRCNIKPALVQNQYYGYQIDFERCTTEKKEVYPVYGGTFWLIWDGCGNLLIAPQHPKAPRHTVYWLELMEQAKNHILVNV
jgi:hypothetical protein